MRVRVPVSCCLFLVSDVGHVVEQETRNEKPASRRNSVSQAGESSVRGGRLLFWCWLSLSSGHLVGVMANVRAAYPEDDVFGDVGGMVRHAFKITRDQKRI